MARPYPRRAGAENIRNLRHTTVGIAKRLMGGAGAVTYRDPESVVQQFRAAQILGRIEADGLLPEGEASKTMGNIVKVAFARAPGVDQSGLRARLVWEAKDSRAAREIQRENAATAVRWAAMGLIKANANRDKTLEAARNAAGDVLTDAEILPILAKEWNRIHKNRGRK